MIAIFFVYSVMIGASFLASLLDGVLVGASVADVEYLKKNHPKLGRAFEYYQSQPDRTLSAILAIDTSASTICAAVLGALMVKEWGESSLLLGSIFITFSSFVFSDILPKTLGVFYRRRLLRYVVRPIQLVTWVMYPVSVFCSWILRIFLPKSHTQEEELSDESLILTAQKGVQAGVLSSIEGTILEHTLTLDDELVENITQKKIFSIEKHQTVDEVFEKYPEIPYGRVPVYDGKKSNIVGILRRRDLLKTVAEDRHQEPIANLMQPAVRIPFDAKISTALEMFLRHFQQIAIVEDADEQPIGVLTLEDIFEYIIGQDIFEYDDISNYTRSDARKLRLARKKRLAQERSQRQ